MSRARRSTALTALLAEVAPSSAKVGTGALTSSEDHVLATDKAKQEATAALGAAGHALRVAEALHSKQGTETTRALVEARQRAVDAATVAFDAAWDLAFEALEAHDGQAQDSAA